MHIEEVVQPKCSHLWMFMKALVADIVGICAYNQGGLPIHKPLIVSVGLDRSIIMVQFSLSLPATPELLPPDLGTHTYPSWGGSWEPGYHSLSGRLEYTRSSGSSFGMGLQCWCCL